MEDDFEKIDGDNLSIFNDQQRLLASEINKFNSDKEILLKELMANPDKKLIILKIIFRTFLEIKVLFNQSSMLWINFIKRVMKAK